jgi:hypothetical protein
MFYYIIAYVKYFWHVRSEIKIPLLKKFRAILGMLAGITYTLFYLLPENVRIKMWKATLICLLVCVSNFSLKNAVFSDVTPRGSCKNQRFTFIIRVTRISELRMLAVTSN